MPRPFTVASRSKRRTWRGVGHEPEAGVTALTDHLRLADAPRELFDGAALDRWSLRLGAGARDAAKALARMLEGLRGSIRDVHVQRFMTGGNALSALDVPPTAWLRVTETQITRPLAGFINEGGRDGPLPFSAHCPARALSCPHHLTAAARLPRCRPQADVSISS